MFKDLAHLFASSARIKVLKFFILQPDVRVTAPTVSATLGAPKALVEQELRALTRFGLLECRKQKKVNFFMLESDHPVVEPLQAFFTAISMPSNDDIMGAFRKVRGVTLLIATGVLAQESRGAIDLLIVTRKPKDAQIARAVKRLEAAVALPLRYAVLESGDYESRLESYDRLLRDVFEFSHRIIVGRR
ncbi:hypothetical protein A2841_03600 [Candidatus Kaiserbacteria bacterium RIFCSPHIGHO2_01_FULL_48_10]|uniref:HTH arsR-type domain-containing protein n=1 Tax=Candidatus Kaiserbacteria bacterium RIFCSPHIGHO2_01_FULL_48_10 TaxID=1798476 RepID=A0A1F6C424_9BACT|nr:MAG: hypothetical protein A2841_03600 [Candidatus Kaiserbacteria bacterium RIFCSPHIGHO2_01_FULL_48_10]